MSNLTDRIRAEWHGQRTARKAPVYRAFNRQMRKRLIAVYREGWYVQRYERFVITVPEEWMGPDATPEQLAAVDSITSHLRGKRPGRDGFVIVPDLRDKDGKPLFSVSVVSGGAA